MSAPPYAIRPAVPVRVVPCRAWCGFTPPRPGRCRVCDRPHAEPDVVGLACAGCVADLGPALREGRAPWVVLDPLPLGAEVVPARAEWAVWGGR